MPEMLKQLQLSVSALRQDWSTEWLHDLLDRYRLACQLVSCRAVYSTSLSAFGYRIAGTRYGIHTRPFQKYLCPPAASPYT